MASEPTTEPTDERPTDTAAAGAVAPSDETQSTSDAAPSVQAPAKKATRKRATTSRARKAAPASDTKASIQPGEAVDPGGTEGAAGADAPVAAPAPVKRSRARRAKAPEAAPAVDPPAEAPVEDVAAGPDPAEDSGAEEAESAHSAEGAGAGETTLDDAAPEDATSEVGEKDSEDSEDEGGADAAARAAELPSFGLLFKAPEPVTPRRRRATAAAGAPAPSGGEPDAANREESADETPDTRRGGRRSDRARSDQTRADEARDDVEGADEGSTGDPSSASDDIESSGTRRSRRRGGRGRRARDGDQPGQEGQDTQDGAAEGGASEQSGSDQARKPTRRGRRESGSGADGADAGGADSSAAESTGPDASGSELDDDTGDGGPGSSRRRRRRRSGSDGESDESRGARARDEVTSLKGSTRLEAKKQRRREGREAGRRRTIITEAEFLARRESVERVMVVRERDSKTQIAVLEDGVLVEHYVSRESGASMIGNVYLGRVQNVLPSMEAAFVDIGKGRNAVLYAGEVNWDAAGLEGNVAKRIENALGSGDTVLVQATKDPIGHKGARLTSQVSLPGRFLVYVPEASMTGISRKLPDTERARLKSILKKIVPDDAGVIVRTAAEGASEEELTADIDRLTKAWEKIQTKAEKAGKKKGSASAPVLLHGEPDLTVKVIRDVFNEDFTSLVVSGDRAWADVSEYLEDVAPELAKRLSKWTSETDLFTQYRVDEQIAKALDRKVWLPSGGSLVIDRTEAMTVVDVNTGKFVGSGGNLEETVTKNNIEAAEEIVRQLRLRDIGGIIVVDFIDMVLESNRDLVVRRLLECLGRDRTKHQVAEVTSLGLVQMTRKRVGSGLLEVFSEPCSLCAGRGVIVHTDPLDDPAPEDTGSSGRGRGRGRGQGNGNGGSQSGSGNQPAGSRGGGRGNGEADRPPPSGPTAAQIAAAAHAAALKANASANGVDGVDAMVAEAVPLGEGTAPAVEPSGDESAPIVDPVRDEAPVVDGQPGSDSAEEAESADPTETTESSEPSESSKSPESSGPRDAEPEAEGTAEPGREPAFTVEPEPASEAAPVRPRRRRGRVVAPAGPPGKSEVRVITTEGD